MSKMEDQLRAKQEADAIKIQKVFRGFLGRKDFKELKGKDNFEKLEDEDELKKIGEEISRLVKKDLIKIFPGKDKYEKFDDVVKGIITSLLKEKNTNEYDFKEKLKELLEQLKEKNNQVVKYFVGKYRSTGINFDYNYFKNKLLSSFSNKVLKNGDSESVASDTEDDVISVFSDASDTLFSDPARRGSSAADSDDDDQETSLSNSQKLWKETWPKRKSWVELSNQGYFSDNHGITSITEVCADDDEKEQPNFWLYKDGSIVAFFKGRKGLNSLSSQLANANNNFSELDYPIVSFAKVKDVEQADGGKKDIYSLALKTKHGITQSFVDDTQFNELKKTYHEEYEIGLLAFASGEILVNKIKELSSSLHFDSDDCLNDFNANLKAAFEGSLDKDLISDLRLSLNGNDPETVNYLEELLTDLKNLSRFLKNPPEKNLEAEEWLQKKEEQNENVKKIAQKIKNYYHYFDVSNQQPIDVYNSRLNNDQNFQEYFSDLNQAKLADEAARKFSTHSASRIIGNRAEEKIKQNAAEVDLTKEEAEEIAEKFLNEKYGTVDNEKLIPKITYTENGIFWGEKTVTRERNDREQEQWLKDFKKDYQSLLEQPIPSVASGNSSSVHRPRNRNDIATVLFDGNPANNRMFLSLKGTNKYVMAERCKSESKGRDEEGKIVYLVDTFENGKPVQKKFTESQIGKVIIPQNTIFTLDKKTGEYVPQNAMDLLKPNLANPEKEDQSRNDFEIYKNFKVKAVSNVDGKRHMATLFQGEVITKDDLSKKISLGLNSETLKVEQIKFDQKEEEPTVPKKIFDVKVGSIDFEDEITKSINVFCEQSYEKNVEGADVFIRSSNYFIKFEKTAKDIAYLKELNESKPNSSTGADEEVKNFIDPRTDDNQVLKVELNENLLAKIKNVSGEPSKTLEEYIQEFSKNVISVEFKKTDAKKPDRFEVKGSTPSAAPSAAKATLLGENTRSKSPTFTTGLGR